MKKSIQILIFILSIFIFCSCNQNKINETSSTSTETSQTEQTSQMEETSQTEETSSAESSPQTEQTEQQILLPQSFVSPEDEVKITKTFTGVNAYGMRMDISVQGYASESLGMDFYLKSNEENAFEFTLTNGMELDAWQFAPCIAMQFWFDVAESEQGGQIIKLYYTDMMTFAQAVSYNELPIGEVQTQRVRLYPADWQGSEENVCVRSGIVSFPYRFEGRGYGNTHSVSIELSYTEVFVSAD